MGNRKLSYRRLQTLSNRIAAVLIERDLPAATQIGVMMNDRINMILAVIGILNARCVFVPIDSALPEVRIEGMLATVDVELLLCDGGIEPPVGGTVEILRIEELINDQKNGDACLPEVPYEPDDQIYIYFTSGTSGAPKAIVGKNKSLQHFIEWEIETFGFQPGSRVSQLVHPGFDAFLRDVFVPLCCGGTVCIPQEHDMAEGPGALCRWLDRMEIQAIHCVPSLFRMICQYQDLRGDLFRHLQWVMLSGEKIEIPLLSRWNEVFGRRVKIVNFYGPTETTMIKTFHIIKEEDLERERIPVGKPMKGARVLILDQRFKVCRPLVAGEIYIRTPYATHGYYKDDSLNRSLFIPNPSSGDPNDLVFKTGDMGRFLKDGTIDLLSRIDRQVKIRGIRVELEEIEAVMKQCPGIDLALADVRDIGEDNRLLCAYITSSADNVEDLPERLNAFCRQRLPEVMVPANIQILEKIPLKPNGKVDYSALPAPLTKQGEEKVKPRTNLEQRLHQIWAKILGIEDFGVNEPFFRLGGNSLSVLSLISVIQREFDRKFTLKEVFQHNTVRQQADILSEAEEESYEPIPVGLSLEDYPLSPAQERMYMAYRMDPEALAYNVPVACTITGALETERLHGVFEQLIRRHQVLRTSFVNTGEGVRQRVHQSVEFRIEDDDTVRPFDLERPPLMRVALRQTGGSQYQLFVDMHHIAADGISTAVLMKEFTQYYRGETLPSRRVDYKDFVQWQQSDVQERLLNQQKEYWLGQLKGGLHRLNLPLDFPRPKHRGFTGKSAQWQLGRDLASAVRALAAREELTLHMVFLSIYAILLSRLSGQEEVLIGTPVSGRRHPDLEHMVGMFVNTLVLRLFPEGDNSAVEFLGAVKETAVAALDNQDVALESLFENLEFDVCFVMQNMALPSLNLPGLRLEAAPLEGATAKFDLTFRVDELDDDLLLTLEYRSDLFSRESILRWLGYIDNLVGELVARPREILQSLDMMPAEEREWLQANLNNSEVDYPGEAMIHQLFQRQAEARPHAVVLIGDEEDNGVQLTYGFLNDLASRVCAGLKRYGAFAGNIVALHLDRRVETLAAILGTLKSGCGYCPIDLDQPRRRSEFILKDSGARFAIVSEHSPLEIQHHTCVLLPITRFFNQEAVETLESEPMDSSFPAYVIYTSGTSGRPKGVLVEHRQVVRLFFNDNPLFDFGPEDVWTLFHSLCFDFSVWEMYGALLFGGRLAMVSKAAARDTRLFLKLLLRCRVTVLNQTPSAFNNLADELAQTDGPNLCVKMVIFGGEALNPSQLKAFNRIYPEIRLINMYGITETTVHVTFKQLETPDLDSSVSAIGKPIPTLFCRVTDRRMNPCPTNTAGELLVGGAGVARGYLNRPELTHEKFVSGVYRSGDLARLLPSGDLEYLGRVDQQVKIRGFRIEPAEIENRLLSHELVAEAIVLAHKNGGNEQSLCAYFVPSADHTANTSVNVTTLREYVATRLPEYMIPASFVQMEAMPLTANGKVDRRRLPQPHMNHNEAILEPLGEKERSLAAVWAQVLGLEQASIGRCSNFFEMGGHSLKAAKLSAEIHRHMGYDVPLAAIFSNPTLQTLAECLRERDTASVRTIEAVERREYYPQTPGQGRIFLLNQLEDMGLSYNMPSAYWMIGPLDREKLRRSFGKLLERHSPLRTSFHFIHRQPVQKIHDFTEGELEVELMENDDNTADQLMAAFFRPFDLERPPLFRVGLRQFEPERHLLLIDAHHIVTDGLSIRILVEDFLAFYNGDSLPMPEIQYHDYACWVSESGNRQKAAEQLLFWKEVYGNGIPQSNLPTDFRREESRTFRGGTVPITVEDELSRRLLACVSSHETTLFNVMMTVFVILLSRLGGQEDVVVGTVTAGRELRELEDMAGMFVNTLALKYECPDELSLANMMRDVRTRSQRAFANQDVQFEDLVRELQVEAQPGRNPLFDAMLVIQNFEIPDIRLPDLELKPEAVMWNQSKFDLTLFVFERDQEVRMKLEYDSSLFKEETVKDMGECLLHIATQVAADSAIPVGEISIRSQGHDVSHQDFIDDLENE
jgi:tyrocidine synthetase-3